ncbi:MAG: type II toxin-antitoxin system RelE/ParE family toxin, partial [Treponema sp.]|nr:type II toxin-antitoxin system RelE/ParE family toxin [Treponema sp.]
MYEVVFYRDKNGKEPVHEYLQDLARQKGKDSRIKLNKIRDYVKALSLYGTGIGEPYIKHLEGDIWELRPIR